LGVISSLTEAVTKLLFLNNHEMYWWSLPSIFNVSRSIISVPFRTCCQKIFPWIILCK
jgi:hypothetical protein